MSGFRIKDPEQARYYGSTEWKAKRAQVRREEPICYRCGVNPTASVDHKDGNWRNNARVNLGGICTPCNKEKSARDHRRRAGQSVRDTMRGCDENGVPLDPNHHWRKQEARAWP